MYTKSQCRTSEYYLYTELHNQALCLLLRIFDQKGQVIREFQGMVTSKDFATQIIQNKQDLFHLQSFLDYKQNLRINRQSGQINIEYTKQNCKNEMVSENLSLQLPLKNIIKQYPQNIEHQSTKGINNLEQIKKMCVGPQFTIQQLKQFLIGICNNITELKEKVQQSQNKKPYPLSSHQNSHPKISQQQNINSEQYKQINQKLANKLNLIEKNMSQLDKKQSSLEESIQMQMSKRVKKINEQIQQTFQKLKSQIKQQVLFAIGNNKKLENPLLFNTNPNPFRYQKIISPLNPPFPMNAEIKPLIKSIVNPRMSKISPIEIRFKMCENDLFKKYCEITPQAAIRYRGIAPKKIAIFGEVNIRKVSTFGFKIINSKYRNISFGIGLANLSAHNTDFNSIKSENKSLCSYYECNTGNKYSGSQLLGKQGNGVMINELCIVRFDPDTSKLEWIVNGAVIAQDDPFGVEQHYNVFVPMIMFNDPGDMVQFYEEASY